MAIACNTNGTTFIDCLSMVNGICAKSIVRSSYSNIFPVNDDIASFLVCTYIRAHAHAYCHTFLLLVMLRLTRSAALCHARFEFRKPCNSHRILMSFCTMIIS